MHDDNFILDSRVKILAVNSVSYDNGTISATITTSHFNIVTVSPYKFNLLDWAEVVQRGWVE